MVKGDLPPHRFPFFIRQLGKIQLIAKSAEIRHIPPGLKRRVDFSRAEVVDHIYNMIEKILSESRVSYIKWDMNRSITECFGTADT